uniref:MI domain-containing protein n=2 Tax=Micrurus corallinus TaxID=54390 RepID=A0A2D4GIG5_MICCO
MDFPDSQTKELCNMILDCCAQQRTYEKFFGLLAGRFCMLKKEYMESFEAIFKEQYDTIHRLETNKLRNVAKMFAHLLYTDSLPWSVLECISLSEETTTSSSRIFVKIFFQELSEYMGLPNLNARLKDETLQPFFEGLLPRDNPRNTRFAINFFTSIGLGGLTDELREHLKNAPKIIMTQKQDVESSDSSSESGTSDSDEDSSSSETSGSSSGSESTSDNTDSSDSDKKKSQKKKNTDKGTLRKQGNKKKKLEKEKERRWPEWENGAARNSERNADKSSSRKDEASYDRDYSSDRNNSRSGKERNQEKNVLLDSKTSHSKKRKEGRPYFSDDEDRDRHHKRDSKLRREKDRSKSRERPHHYPSPREFEENSQYSNQFKEIRKDESRRRHRNASPSRHK